MPLSFAFIFIITPLLIFAIFATQRAMPAACDVACAAAARVRDARVPRADTLRLAAMMPKRFAGEAIRAAATLIIVFIDISPC